MTTPPAAPSDASGAVPTVTCIHCEDVVPVARFCGYCGADLERPPAGRLALVRGWTFVVAPLERVLLPMITSTLFPQLPRTYRNPFRVGMAVMLLGVIGLSQMRLIGPLVTLVALGVPVLFMLYLWQADVLRDVPKRVFAVAAMLGIAFGVGWVWFTGGLVARTYGIPMAAGFVLQNLIGVGLLVSVGGAILMVLPAVLVRIVLIRNDSSRESLDGFAVGALGALSFTGAATTTRLAPQFVAGLIDDVRPLRLLIEAVLYGVAVPLTAASAGGLIGMLLWFRPGKRAGEHRGAVRVVLAGFAVLVLGVYTVVWLIDASRLPKWPQLGLHILLTVFALLATRVCLQLALLHEKPDSFAGDPVLCVHCERVVPGMPFCPACGAAARASSRSSRRQRREVPPERSAANS